jgi:hypothetical protein
MQRSAIDPGSPLILQSLEDSLTKEYILQEWESTHETLLQREREMVNMSRDFIGHIKSARAESEALLQANHSMLEESRRRGQQLKKLEAFFTAFPLPHSIRQPVAEAFMSVGIQLPWYSTARLEHREQKPFFSDTDIHDSEDLCTNLQIAVAIKDQLAQKLLDQKVAHEAEMEAFVLHHKNSIGTAQHNSMLATAQWTMDRLALESRIREKEVRVKKLVQETYLLKQSIEKLKGQCRCNLTEPQGNPLEHLSRKKDIAKIEQLSPISNVDRAASPSRMETKPQLSFDDTPVVTFSNSPSNSLFRQLYEPTIVPEPLHKIPSHPQNKQLALTAKGTKICSDIRSSYARTPSDPVSIGDTSGAGVDASHRLRRGSTAIPNSAPS